MHIRIHCGWLAITCRYEYSMSHRECDNDKFCGFWRANITRDWPNALTNTNIKFIVSYGKRALSRVWDKAQAEVRGMYDNRFCFGKLPRLSGFWWVLSNHELIEVWGSIHSEEFWNVRFSMGELLADTCMVRTTQHISLKLGVKEYTKKKAEN